MDSFAQTAGTDDLFFDDDFTPVAEPVVEQNPVEAPPEDPIPGDAPPTSGLGQSQHSQNTPRGPASAERGGRGRVRARVRGRGRGGANGSDAREAKEKPQEKETIDADAAPEANTTEAAEPPSAPTGPKDPKPTHSVRGDRTLTGGTPRARLTEEELNAKLASMRSRNEALTAAHARAEADLANFEAREALAAQKNAERRKQQAERQKQERQNRQQMMGEREKNRQRKLEAQQGREWDFGKEEGFVGTGDERRRGAARGAYGGVAPSPRPAASEGWTNPDPQQEEASISTHLGRGRGRGRGRGGRTPRGSHNDASAPKKEHEAQHPPTASDFPSLPAAAAPAPTDSGAPKKLDFPIKTKTAAADAKSVEPERPDLKKQESFGLPSPAGPGKSWADQVEGS